MRGGFIHIPYLPEQAARLPGVPSMALDTVIAALRIAVATALVVREDVRETGGQLQLTCDRSCRCEPRHPARR